MHRVCRFGVHSEQNAWLVVSGSYTTVRVMFLSSKRFSAEACPVMRNRAQNEERGSTTYADKCPVVEDERGLSGLDGRGNHKGEVLVWREPHHAGVGDNVAALIDLGSVRCERTSVKNGALSQAWADRSDGCSIGGIDDGRVGLETVGQSGEREGDGNFTCWRELVLHVLCKSPDGLQTQETYGA